MEKPTTEEIAYLKGYAEALQDILFELTGSNDNAKSYDPLDFRENYFLSYAYTLKSGARRHYLEEFVSKEEIKKLMLEEVSTLIKEAEE